MMPMPLVTKVTVGAGRPPVSRTVRRKVVLAVSDPSLTVTVISDWPVWSVAGTTMTVRLALAPPKEIFPLGTNAGFEDDAVSVRLPTGVEESPMVKFATMVVFIGMVRGLMVVMVGAPLAGVTVTTKVRVIVLFTAWPSLTVTVIVAEPLALGTGVNEIDPVELGLE